MVLLTHGGERRVRDESLGAVQTKAEGCAIISVVKESRVLSSSGLGKSSVSSTNGASCTHCQFFHSVANQFSRIHIARQLGHATHASAFGQFGAQKILMRNVLALLQCSFAKADILIFVHLDKMSLEIRLATLGGKMESGLHVDLVVVGKRLKKKPESLTS